MTDITRKAYSYIRFSTPDQLKGDSLNRQVRLSQEYAKNNNLILDDSLNLRDLGVSSFKGKNIKTGALSRFIEAVRTGVVQKGSYLLVESFDRISREEVTESLRLFLNLLDEEITIVTLSDGMVYRKGEVDSSSLMLSILIMSRAHEESLIKSKRIKASWKSKRENIDNFKLTKVAPSWLVLSEDRKSFELIEERVEVIKLIFELSISGLGAHLIGAELQNMGINKWKTLRSDKNPKWHLSYIKKILDNRAVLGEITLQKGTQEELIVPNYYPQIISEDVFYKEKNARDVRTKIPSSGRQGKKVSNLFKGLLVCGYSCNEMNASNYRCDGNNEVFSYTNKGNSADCKYLRCSRVISNKNNCKEFRKSIKYSIFEKQLLCHLKELDVDELFQSESKNDSLIREIETKLLTSQGKLRNLEESIQKITEAILVSNKSPEFLVEKGISLEDEKKELVVTIKNLKRSLNSEKVKAKSKNVSKSELDRLIDKFENEKDIEKLAKFRLKLREKIREIVTKIDVYPLGSDPQNRVKKLFTSKFNDKEIETILSSRSSLFEQNPVYVIHLKNGNTRILYPEFEQVDGSIANLLWNDELSIDENIGNNIHINQINYLLSHKDNDSIDKLLDDIEDKTT